MGYLIALGMLVAFSAALLSSYGRKLLMVMTCVVVVIGLVLYALATAPGPKDSATMSEAVALEPSPKAPESAAEAARPLSDAKGSSVGRQAGTTPDPWAKYLDRNAPRGRRAEQWPADITAGPGPFDDSSSAASSAPIESSATAG